MPATSNEPPPASQAHAGRPKCRDESPDRRDGDSSEGESCATGSGGPSGLARRFFPPGIAGEGAADGPDGK